MSTPSPLCGWRRGAGPSRPVRQQLSRGSAATTTAALESEELRHTESSGPPATGWPLNRANRFETKAASAVFSLGRSFLHEPYLERLESPKDIGRRVVDCGRHHRRRALTTGPHAGRGRQRHRRYAGRRNCHSPSGPSRPGSRNGVRTRVFVHRQHRQARRLGSDRPAVAVAVCGRLLGCDHCAGHRELDAGARKRGGNGGLRRIPAGAGRCADLCCGYGWV